MRSFDFRANFSDNSLAESLSDGISANQNRARLFYCIIISFIHLSTFQKSAHLNEIKSRIFRTNF